MAEYSALRVLQQEHRWVMNTNKEVLDCFRGLYEGLIAHDGFGEMRLEFRILRRGQKEVVIHCGKQYRFIVDYRPSNPLAWEVRRESEQDQPHGGRAEHGAKAAAAKEASHPATESAAGQARAAHGASGQLQPGGAPT